MRFISLLLTAACLTAAFVPDVEAKSNFERCLERARTGQEQRACANIDD